MIKASSGTIDGEPRTITLAPGTYIIKETYYDSKGNLTENFLGRNTVIYKYDSNNNQIGLTNYNIEGNILSKFKYIYGFSLIQPKL